MSSYFEQTVLTLTFFASVWTQTEIPGKHFATYSLYPDSGK
jgi:hypothetical protein